MAASKIQVITAAHLICASAQPVGRKKTQLPLDNFALKVQAQ
jgi:hypothetical protein